MPKGYNSFQTNPPLKLSKDLRQLLGLLGSSLLFLGVFTPIISYPLIGSLNFFQHSSWNGPLMLILAVISIFLSLTGRYSRLGVTGFISLGIVAQTFIAIQLKLGDLQEMMARRLAGIPLRNLADKSVSSLQIRWGWALLVFGALLLIAAAVLKEGLARESDQVP